MPTYEMPLLLRAMTRPEITTTLKRVSTVIFSKGGFIRKIDNLGLQPTPYKTKAHEHVYKEANYFIFHFDIPPLTLGEVKEEYGRDVDIIRNRIFKRETEEARVRCTLHKEILAPAYRPDVQKMVAIAKYQGRKKPVFNYNSGFDYYPFQR